MNSYLQAIGVIFLLLVGWLAVQQLARRFARRHPEFGPAREEGGQCGISCGCDNWKNCEKSKKDQEKAETA